MFADAANAPSARSRWAFEDAEQIYPAFVPIQGVEAALAHAELYPARRDKYGDDVAHAARARAHVHARGLRGSDRVVRERVRSSFARLFSEADLLLTPIRGRRRPSRSATPRRRFRDGVLPFTVPQDITGLPACAVPVGFDDLGLPVGVQLTGPPYSEGRVLAAARAHCQPASIGEGGMLRLP